MESLHRPKVGVGVIIVNEEGKVLMGKRNKGHGNNTYMIPGGHLEFGETFEQAVEREAFEETGTVVKAEKLVSIGNAVDYDKHYISVVFLARYVSGTLRGEKDVTSDWAWYDKEKLPENIFLPSKVGIQNWLDGIMYRKFCK